jgi:hypothetical protein
MKALTILVVAAMTLPQVLACCMLPRSYSGSIRQNGHEGVIFHHDGRQDMILRINYAITGDTAPGEFAWIVTVPNEPERYAVADRDIFEETFDWAWPLVKPPPPRTSFLGMVDSDEPQAGALKMSKKVEVGAYDIQPIKVKGAEALGALNDWLSANEFPTEDPGHMRYFVENGFTFLCIKINPAKGKKLVSASGELEPLHLSFKSKSVYYPLRFSSRQGVFDVDLTVLTRKKIDYKRSAANLAKINWIGSNLKKNVKVSRDHFPDPLAAAYTQSSFKGLTEKTWYLNVIETRRTNHQNSIANWDSDVFFVTSGRTAKSGFGIFGF